MAAVTSCEYAPLEKISRIDQGENSHEVVPYLYEKIQGSQGNDHYQKDGCSKTNRKECANDRTKGSEKRGQTSGHHVINAADILGKAVHDPPLGGGLKE